MRMRRESLDGVEALVACGETAGYLVLDEHEAEVVIRPHTHRLTADIHALLALAGSHDPDKWPQRPPSIRRDGPGWLSEAQVADQVFEALQAYCAPICDYLQSPPRRLLPEFARSHVWHTLRHAECNHERSIWRLGLVTVDPSHRYGRYAYWWREYIPRGEYLVLFHVWPVDARHPTVRASWLSARPYQNARTLALDVVPDLVWHYAGDELPKYIDPAQPAVA
jgi:hypothetical protein